jgi:LemA protein
MKIGKWIALGAIIIILLSAWSSYNGLVNRDEAVNGGWSENQNQIKRRNDLVPNLVSTVKGYVAHESGVLEQVTEARAKVGQAVNIDVAKLANDPALQKQLLAAQQSLNASLGRLIAVAENYPQLKADQGFLKLQDELAGTENRIAVARGRAIKATQEFNQYRRGFPTNIVAGVIGFERKQYYEAPAEEQKVPVVDFGKR